MSDYENLPQISVSLLNAAALSKRSSLYVWMLQNHDTFAEVLRKAGRPNWEALARMFADQGLKNAEGRPPSEDTTRQTWWKVRKAMKARRDRQPAVQKPTAGSAAPVARTRAPDTQPDEEQPTDDDDRPQFDFDKARITKR